MITEVIPRKDALDFLSGIERSLLNMSEDEIYKMYLFVEHRNAVAISFDSSWRPFIGYTRGYNSPEERAKISGGAFLALVRSRFQTSHQSEIPGGRVFLAANRAYNIDEVYEYTFLQWIWLGKSLSLVEDVLQLLRRYRLVG